MISTKGDGVRAADAAISNYQQQARDLDTEFGEIRRNRESIVGELEATIANLATGLLPSSDRDVIQQAADETGAMHLPSRLDELEQQRKGSANRVEEIDNDRRYVDRDLLTNPTTGDFSLKINEHQEYVDSFRDGMQPYELKEFQWLRKRGVHEQREFGVFDRFWRAMTLSNMREQKAIQTTLEKLGAASLSECVAEYDQIKQKLDHHQGELQQWTDRRQEVLDLVEEKSQLTHWLENFPDEATQSLRADLTKHLSNCDMQAIHEEIRQSAKILTAKCHALSEKLTYLDNMVNFLRKEIDDRKKRVHSITSVRNKWAVKPYGHLRGDKTKWLVTVPNMKRESTRKRVGWIQSMHHNVYHYDSYHEYNTYMDAHMMFLAYDAFAYRADERMPYEGFSRTVIQDLDCYRDDHNMERADYSDFKEAILEQPEEPVFDDMEDQAAEMMDDSDADASEVEDVKGGDFESDGLDDETASAALAEEMAEDDDGGFEDAS